jgi:hypothetical protein
MTAKNLTAELVVLGGGDALGEQKGQQVYR